MAATLNTAGPETLTATDTALGTNVAPVTSAAASVTEFTAPAGLGQMVTGPDGDFYFTAPQAIVQAAPGAMPGTFVYTSFGPTVGQVNGLTVGPDGNIWFTESDRIGKLDIHTSTPTLTEYGSGLSNPKGITSGPDGNIWFTESGTNAIGNIDTNGTINEISLPGVPTNAGLDDITTGIDGALWFTETNVDVIGRYLPGATTPYTETPLSAGSAPTGITVGPSGYIWFAETGLFQLAYMKSPGAVFEIGLQEGLNPYPDPMELTMGPGTNVLWFTSNSGSGIGSYDFTENTTSFTATTSGGAPVGIATGPDGNVWFTDPQNNMIGQVKPTVTADVAAQLVAIGGSDAKKSPPGLSSAISSRRRIKFGNVSKYLGERYDLGCYHQLPVHGSPFL